MYGMLLESVQHFIQQLHDEQAWNKVLEHINLKNVVFTTHKRYSNELMVRLARACSEILLDATEEEYMAFFGRCFVEYFTHYGYDTIMRVSGRHYRDFLHGIDNLHETMRFSYPKMLSPSFYVEEETDTGCLLHYRSKRIGFTHYVIGQLKQMGMKFYDVNVDVEILKETISAQGCHVVYQLHFKNSGFIAKCTSRKSSFQASESHSHISGSMFFKVFPFSIVFNRDMQIIHIGPTLQKLFSQTSMLACDITTKFCLRRPQLVEFTWANIICLQKVIFELESNSPIVQTEGRSKPTFKSLLLKGQMRYMDDLKGCAFLCKPLLSSLEEMQNLGLYLNDLNMHDSSREMVMAGWQHASRLEYSIEEQIGKSKLIADNLQELDEWQQKSENLLYSMIPRQIAIRLKNGEDPMNTCETFDQVTIMFSYLLGFTDLCAQVSAMDLVSCINSVFTTFDDVVDQHDVFKVETLGDAVYMVAGGVPDRKPNHAQSVACVALELINKVQELKEPFTQQHKLDIRIGMHTGSVVAGVVGQRMPQYCLFGDTVNTASRMQTYSQAGRIHISEPCQQCLRKSEFLTVFRDKVNIKGKGNLNTYWLIGRQGSAQAERMMSILEKENKPAKIMSRSTDPNFDFRKRKYSDGCINISAGSIPIIREKAMSPLSELPLSFTPPKTFDRLQPITDEQKEQIEEDEVERRGHSSDSEVQFRIEVENEDSVDPVQKKLSSLVSSSSKTKASTMQKRRRASIGVPPSMITLKPLDFVGSVPKERKPLDVRKVTLSYKESSSSEEDVEKAEQKLHSPQQPSSLGRSKSSMKCPFSGMFSFQPLNAGYTNSLSVDTQASAASLTVPALSKATKSPNGISLLKDCESAVTAKELMPRAKEDVALSKCPSALQCPVQHVSTQTSMCLARSVAVQTVVDEKAQTLLNGWHSETDSTPHQSDEDTLHKSGDSVKTHRSLILSTSCPLQVEGLNCQQDHCSKLTDKED